MKIRLVVAELFHVERRTDERRDRHDEANIHFSKFCNGTKSYLYTKTDCFCPPPSPIMEKFLNILENTKVKKCRSVSFKCSTDEFKFKALGRAFSL